MTTPQDMSEKAAEIAHGLSRSQFGLLDDLCDCPGLFAGQYTYDGAGIEHLPRDLWNGGYKDGMYAMLGLQKAFPSELGLAVRHHLDHSK